jgi:hypothetical protein
LVDRGDETIGGTANRFRRGGKITGENVGARKIKANDR